MSKAAKLKNNTYWDSSSIVHNRAVLNTILNKNINGRQDFVETSDIMTSHDNQALGTMRFYRALQQSNGSPEPSAEGIILIYRTPSSLYGWIFGIFNGNIYTRYRANGTWGNWKKVAFLN